MENFEKFLIVSNDKQNYVLKMEEGEM